MDKIYNGIKRLLHGHNMKNLMKAGPYWVSQQYKVLMIILDFK